MTAAFVIAPLSAEHDRLGFHCGVDALDRYLQTQAGQDMRRHVSNCFIASPTNANAIAGYYTFASASVPVTDLPEAEAKRLPRYPVMPAALIGRLAIDRQYQKRGLGAAMLFDAIKRAAASDAAVFALIVDAKDDNAASFYRHHGFRPFASRPRSLFLPIATATKILER